MNLCVVNFKRNMTGIIGHLMNIRMNPEKHIMGILLKLLIVEVEHNWSYQCQLKA